MPNDTDAVARLAYEASQTSLAWVAPYYPDIRDLMRPWHALRAFERHAWRVAVQAVRQHDQSKDHHKEDPYG